MDLTLSAAQQTFRDQARDFADRVLRPRAVERDRTGEFPADEYRALGRMGFLGFNVPEAYGGSAAGTIALCAALDEIAHACAATAVGMSVTNMVAEILCRFGSDALKARFVPRLTSGEAIAGAFCLSEPGAGSDAGSLAATARRDGDDYVLNGTKMWITSGAYSGVLVVMARTGGPGSGGRGLSAFVLEAGVPGLVVGKHEDKTGLRGSNTVPIILEDCRVPAAQLLGAEGMGFRVAMTALDGGRITIGAMANGIARAAMERAAAHVHGRTYRGAPLGRQQAVGKTLADMATGVEAAQLMVWRAAWSKERGIESGQRYTLPAAMAKLFATENARRVTEEAVQLLGHAGYERGEPVERFMRDARVTTIFEGTSEVQRLVVARALIERLAA